MLSVHIRNLAQTAPTNNTLNLLKMPTIPVVVPYTQDEHETKASSHFGTIRAWTPLDILSFWCKALHQWFFHYFMFSANVFNWCQILTLLCFDPTAYNRIRNNKKIIILLTALNSTKITSPITSKTMQMTDSRSHLLWIKRNKILKRPRQWKVL